MKRNKKCQVGYNLFIPLFFVILAISNAFSASTISEKNIPVSMSIYHEDYPSSLYIKCKVEDFNGIKFDMFNPDNELPKKEFKRLVSSIKDNDANSFRAFGKNFRGELYNDGVIRKADTNLKGFQKLFQRYNEYGDGLKIYSRLLIGNGGLFIFGTDAKDALNRAFTSQRLSLEYEKVSSNKIRWSSATQSVEPLISIIVNTFQEIARQPEKYQKQKTPKTPFDYNILIPGTEGANPAYLKFNGKTYNIDIMSEKVPSDDQVLGFYQKAYLTWRDVSTQEFIKYYTESSQQRTQKAEAKTPYLDNLRKSLSKGRRVLFIMDANPFYVVFYRVGEINKAVYHEYIVIDPNDGKLKLNLPTMDFTTQYFMSDEFYSILNKVDPKLFPVRTPIHNNTQ